jgi:small redox-active disulfide protein 2
MMEVKVLGPGCPKCEQLAANTQAALTALGLAVKVEKIKDLKDIAAHGVFVTPALMVDGEVKVAGRVPNPEELKKFFPPKG